MSFKTFTIKKKLKIMISICSIAIRGVCSIKHIFLICLAKVTIDGSWVLNVTLLRKLQFCDYYMKKRKIHVLYIMRQSFSKVV